MIESLFGQRIQFFIPGEMSFIVSAKTSTSNQFKILKKFRNDCVSL
jgi:hypothetical protein